MINNTTYYQGGVIYVGGNGAKDVATFNMTNGVIANNKAANGGAIAIGNGGTNTVNITGGVIRDNSAAGGKGGAFYLVTGAAKSSLTIDKEALKTGSAYSTQQKEFEGYTFVKTTGSATSGVMTKSHTVTYVYRQNPVEVEEPVDPVDPVDPMPEQEVEPDDVQEPAPPGEA